MLAFLAFVKLPCFAKKRKSCISDGLVVEVGPGIDVIDGESVLCYPPLTQD